MRSQDTMNKKTKHIFTISGPSGVGKNTIINNLLQSNKHLITPFISTTTRNPRVGEIEGVDYYFVSKEEFNKRVDGGAFLEYEEVYKDVFYGSEKANLDKALLQDKVVIFDLDYKGALNLKKVIETTYNNTIRLISIFVIPPTFAVLQERLYKRMIENNEELKINQELRNKIVQDYNKRISKAKIELLSADKFDEIVINADLEKCVYDILQIIFSLSNF
jgi:guanylate kinase